MEVCDDYFFTTCPFGDKPEKLIGISEEDLDTFKLNKLYHMIFGRVEKQSSQISIMNEGIVLLCDICDSMKLYASG
jgi:hypothetical protein